MWVAAKCPWCRTAVRQWTADDGALLVMMHCHPCDAWVRSGAVPDSGEGRLHLCAMVLGTDAREPVTEQTCGREIEFAVSDALAVATERAPEEQWVAVWARRKGGTRAPA